MDTIDLIVQLLSCAARLTVAAALTVALVSPAAVGMSIAVDALFEGRTLAVSQVVLRYRGLAVGDPVTAETATAARRGSVCFAGTDAHRLSIDVRVLRVQIAGNPTGSSVTAAAAFATTTQPTLRPLSRTFSAYVGTQGVPVCDLAG